MTEMVNTDIQPASEIQETEVETNWDECTTTFDAMDLKEVEESFYFILHNVSQCYSIVLEPSRLSAHFLLRLLKLCCGALTTPLLALFRLHPIELGFTERYLCIRFRETICNSTTGCETNADGA